MRLVTTVLVILLLWIPATQCFFLPDWFINWLGYKRPASRQGHATIFSNETLTILNQKSSIEDNATALNEQEQSVEVYQNSGGIFSRPNDDNASKESKKTWRPSRPLNIFDPNFNPLGFQNPNTNNRYTPVLMPFKHSFFPGLVLQGGYPFGKPKPCYLDYNHQHEGGGNSHDGGNRHGGTSDGGQIDDGKRNGTNDRVDKQQDEAYSLPLSVPAADPPSLEENTTTKISLDPVAYSASNYNIESIRDYTSDMEVSKDELTTDPIWEAIQEVMRVTSPPKIVTPPAQTETLKLLPPHSATVIRVEHGKNQGEALLLSAMLLNKQENQFSAPDVQAYLPVKSYPYVETVPSAVVPENTTSSVINVTRDTVDSQVYHRINRTILGSSRGFRPVNHYPAYQRVWKPANYPGLEPSSPYPNKPSVSPTGSTVRSDNNANHGLENATMTGIRFEGGFRPMRMMKRKPFNVNTFAIKV